MKKVLFSAVAFLALASCSNDSLVSDSPVSNEAPIAYIVGQKNITRADVDDSKNLEKNGYYDFGVWAYKYKTTGGASPVMANYQVGCSGYGSFSKVGANKGDWFYDGLGSQVLHYWDYSSDYTNFYAYAPYNKDVQFDDNKIKVPASVNKASTSKASEFIYAGNSITQSNYNKPVSLLFKHLGAIVNLKFYTDIEGYDVELIDANPAVSGSAIQATPTSDKVDKSSYHTAYAALIDYSSNVSEPSVTVDGTPTTSDANLVFTLPEGTLPTSSNHAIASGSTYYAVAQPTTSTTGFTFHVSYKLTAKDNSEVITVRDARVFVPAKDVQNNYIAAWQPSTKYTYTFKITTNTNGKTAEETIDLDDPSVPSEAGLYPIVFDNIQVEDYTDVAY